MARSNAATKPVRRPGSAATRPVRRRNSGEETRAAILAAAERHFAERGFEAARLEDIAADVGIQRAAIFYHFSDKHELYAAVLDEVFSGALRAVPSRGSVAERLETSLTSWIDYVARRPSVARYRPPPGTAHRTRLFSDSIQRSFSTRVFADPDLAELRTTHGEKTRS